MRDDRLHAPKLEQDVVAPEDLTRQVLDLGPDGPRPFDPVVVRPMSEITATLGQVLVDRAAFPAFDAIVGPQQRLVPVDRDAV